MHAPGEAYRTESTSYDCCVTAVASLLTHNEIQTRISKTWPYETYRHAHLSMALPSPISLSSRAFYHTTAVLPLQGFDLAISSVQNIYSLLPHFL